MKPNGYVIYDGPSRLTGDRVIVIVTGFARRSNNAKTGDMLQTWILRADTPPHDAVRSGDDAAVCGDCPLANGNGCYVRTEQAPLRVWKAWQKGRYPAPYAWTLRSFGLATGRKVRVGSYGDPAAVPGLVWDMLLNGSERKRTGYTHQWRIANLQGVCMASVHTGEERAQAKAAGFRTFRTADDGPLPGEIICPATEEGGNKTTCAQCGLCNGSTGPDDSRKDIFAYLHGKKKGRALLAIGG